jgi:predicted SAM-dependent methyltransferase
MKLNLGCGKRPQANYINVDKESLPGVDVVHNLEQFPWPWGYNVAEEILMAHSLEHMGQDTKTFLRIMVELYRILKPDGKLTIKVPHPRSDGYMSDPTHVRPILPQIFTLFNKENCKQFANNNWPNTPLAEYLDVNFATETIQYNLMPYWANLWHNKTITQAQLDHATMTYFNVIDEITIVLVKLE